MRFRLPPILRDAVLPAALAVIATVEALSVSPPGVGFAALLEILACVVLVGRHRWPLAVGVLTGAVVLVPWLGPRVNDLTAPVLILWVAAFTLGREVPRRGLLVVALYAVAVAAGTAHSRGALPVGDVIWLATLIFPPYVVGVLVRRYEERQRMLALEAARLTVAAEQVRREAIAAERARIARELHDILAHSLSAMVVQASAAEDLVRTDPERASAALRHVTAVGREALGETGRLLRVMRENEADAQGAIDVMPELEVEPRVGLRRLPDLVEGFRRSGLSVDLTVEGDAPLPPGVDLSAYRVVQEGLTNALRHGSDGAAAVAVRRSPARVVIQVENRADRPQRARADGGGSGLGLLGIGERVAVFGGRLRHGPTDDGRYVLHVVLPVEGEA
jgi:signal transduction histidine kinase